MPETAPDGGTNVKRWAIAAVVVWAVLAVGLAGWSFWHFRAAEPVRRETLGPKAKEEALLEVDARTLFDDYQRDGAAAITKYQRPYALAIRLDETDVSGDLVEVKQHMGTGPLTPYVVARVPAGLVRGRKNGDTLRIDVTTTYTSARIVAVKSVELRF